MIFTLTIDLSRHRRRWRLSPPSAARVMRWLILAWAGLFVVLALAACSPGQLARGAASAALGGGPDLAANIQAGKSNAQTIGTTRQADQRVEAVTDSGRVEQSTGDNEVRTERVETIEIRNEAPPWVWLLLIAGWVLPSPGELGRALRGLFTRRGRRHADR